MKKHNAVSVQVAYLIYMLLAPCMKEMHSISAILTLAYVAKYHSIK